MASSCTVTNPRQKYEVFINFRGQGSGYNFALHLFDALSQENIKTFIHHGELERGDEVRPSVPEAIEESTISVVVFSEDYASSGWCLGELVKILECKKRGQTVLPVFYYVDPSDVRNQTGPFGAALAKLPGLYEKDRQKAQRWRVALLEAADIPGFSRNDFWHDSLLVQEMVEEILKRLGQPLSSICTNLVGMRPRVKEMMNKYLEVGMPDIRFIGIWGMGGIGKTTIARVVYQILSNQFDATCFLENVREVLKRKGLESLQEKFVSKLQSGTDSDMFVGHDRIEDIRRHLHGKKILLVLDDVDQLEQIENLVGNHDWLGFGSRVIITTRDKLLLILHGVEKIYSVERLDYFDALELFHLEAFKYGKATNDHAKLTKHIIAYANGLPLALKVLGSFLCGKTIEEWKSFLDRKKSYPDEKIFKTLKISYDMLSEIGKEIFLDIACFFNGKNINRVMEMLHYRFDSDQATGIRELIDKSLITISHDKVLKMHDLLQIMGWEIVRRKCPDERGKWSRLWLYNDICHILQNENMGKCEVDGIMLDDSRRDITNLRGKCFSNMTHLKLLKISNVHFHDKQLEYLPNTLRFLKWHGYPFKSLPLSFNPENLYELNMNYSSIEYLWHDIKCLKKLKIMKLRHCNKLMKTPDFSKAPNLERLDLEGCLWLLEVHPSVRFLRKLTILNLKNCKNLKRFQGNSHGLASLKLLDLSGCSLLYKLPQGLSEANLLEELDLRGTSITTIPMSSRWLTKLKTLDPSMVLPFPLIDLSSLTKLDLDNNNLLEGAIPSDIGMSLSSLEELNLRGNNILTLPESIRQLLGLKTLRLEKCQRLKSLPQLPLKIVFVGAEDCLSLETLPSMLLKQSTTPKLVLHLLNCLKLAKNHPNLADVFMTLCLQGPKSRNSYYRCICYPGNEIPKWFCFQIMGSSGVIELPRNWNNKNFLGVAVGAVVQFPDHIVTKDLCVYCSFKTKSKDSDHIEVMSVSFSASCSKSLAIQQDHILLGFDLSTKKHVWSLLDDECIHLSDSNEAYIEFGAYDRGFDGDDNNVSWKVKKCGIHLVYTHGCGEPREEDEEGEAPPSKRLKLSSCTNDKSSLSDHQVKYNVFLSCRDKDTNDSFTSHLHSALCRAKIKTFVDNEGEQLTSEDQIPPSLLNAIEESRISIVVFFNGFASSKWCLEELVKILECKKKHGQVVLPVFYHIDPDDLKNQVNTLQERLEIQKKWRIALSEAENLFSFHATHTRCESLLVEEIVKHILKMLKDIVGIQSRIKKISSLLCIGSKNVGILGICGSGGVGKTTIAKAAFNEICNQFEASYFAQNVREEWERPDGLTTLRQELLAKIFKDQHPNIGCTFIKQRLSRKRVLIVFDDITSLEQIKFLIGDINCLGLGSQVIVTTRDRKVLNNCEVDDDHIYEVEALIHDEALQLFSLYAFQQNCPTLGYNEVSDRVVQYAKGISLTLKVLGSFLFGRQKRVWESVINKLERIHDEDMQMVLKVSYNGLDHDERNIFLDIACLLKLEDRDFVTKFLDASGFFPEIALSIIIDKCLITISDNSKTTMHDLIQEMGWTIIKEESSKNPTRFSRLWYYEDVYHVLKNNMGTEAIEAICLDMSKIEDISIDPCAFAKMYNLRFLKLYNSSREENNLNKVHVSQDLEFNFPDLRYLCWYGCPFKSLPSNFDLENLVALDMPFSKVEQLWTGVQDLVNLKSINLSHSKHLKEVPDLSHATNLKSLILEGCISLLQICSSIQCLKNLVFLNLGHCRSLLNFPTGIHPKSLRKVILSCCSNLNNFPHFSCNMEELYLDETEIAELSPLIEKLSRLVSLNLRSCSRLESLPSNICKLTSLEYLNLSGCSKLDRLPDSLGQLGALKVLKAEDCCLVELTTSVGQLSSLESLFLGGNNFESIPLSIIGLSKLSYLNVSNCEKLRSLPELPNGLQYIDAQNCISLVEASSGLSILFPNIWRDTGVNFINCSNLNQDALTHIMEKVAQKFQDTIMEKRGRFENANQKFLNSCMIFPGSEIPKCFEFQSNTSFMELPRGLVNHNFVGMVLCTVLRFQNYDFDQSDHVKVDCTLNLKIGDGNYNQVVVGCLWLWGEVYRPKYIQTDHVVLGLDSFMFKDGFHETTHNGDAIINFCLTNENDDQVDYCKVIKCGVHVFYVKDSDDTVEEEEQSQPKQLKVSNFEGEPWKILPNMLGYSRSLRSLDLCGCRIMELPRSIGELSSLCFLYLRGNYFESLPTSIIRLIDLQYLDVSHCTRLQSPPKLPRSLADLRAGGCILLQIFSGSSILSSFHSGGEYSYKSAIFIECSSLNKNKLKDILKSVLQNIRENLILAKEVKERRFPVTYQKFIKGGCMIFPGSEILDCFEFQSNASFIKLPGGLFSHNFVGMAVCTVIAFQNYDFDRTNSLKVDCKLSLKSEDGNYDQVTVGIFCPKYAQSDHVLLGFRSDMFRDGFHGTSETSEAFINFCVTTGKDDQVDYCKVIKCGVHLFYMEDSNDMVEEDEEPQPKRLKF